MCEVNRELFISARLAFNTVNMLVWFPVGWFGKLHNFSLLFIAIPELFSPLKNISCDGVGVMLTVQGTRIPHAQS